MDGGCDSNSTITDNICLLIDNTQTLREEINDLKRLKQNQV